MTTKTPEELEKLYDEAVSEMTAFIERVEDKDAQEAVLKKVQRVLYLGIACGLTEGVADVINEAVESAEKV